MTTSEFILATGKEPIQDDLDCANCSEAGTLSHTRCGVCKHGKPVFKCTFCWLTVNMAFLLADGTIDRFTAHLHNHKDFTTRLVVRTTRV